MKLFKLITLCFIVMTLLVACQQPIIQNKNQAKALFSDADLDKAILELATPTDISGQELSDIPDGQVTDLADYNQGDFAPANVLPGAKGFIYYILRDTSLTNQWAIYRFNQNTDSNVLVYQGQRVLHSVSGSSGGTVIYFSARETTSATSDYEIYKLNVNTSAVTQLTNNSSDDINVSSSADANRVAYEGLGTSGQKAVFYRIYSSATSFIERRLSNPVDQYEPSISGNGNFIAFVRLLTASSYRIMLHNISANTYISVNTESSVLNHPSPDDSGNKVAWLRNNTSGYEVRVKNLSTTAIVNAVSSTTQIKHPHITRDGIFLTYGLKVSNSFNVFTKNLSSGAFIKGTNHVSPANATEMYWQTSAGASTATIQGQITRGTGASIMANEDVANEVSEVYTYSYNETAKIQVVDKLLEKAAVQGQVRVIITLSAGFTPEGTLSGASATNQRQGIEQAQTNLLDRFTGRMTRVTRFETVPLLAAEVDADGLQALRNDSAVLWIEEDIAVPPTLAESTARIGATAAWSSGYTGSDWAVAVLDTGVERTHSFLSGKVVSEACYSTTSPAAPATQVCPSGTDPDGDGSYSQIGVGAAAPCTISIDCDHGTHVAGIAAGSGSSFSGVAKGSNIIAIQVFSNFSGDLGAYYSDILKGLERVYALRTTYSIAAANLSLGGGSSTSNCDTNPLKPIIDNLRSAGIATVISSGNNGFTSALGAPACISTAISVGSTNDGSNGATPTDSVSSFSNSASFLSLLAPGSMINSSVPGNGFDNFQGTSMAAPHVAGAWAVMKQRFPSETVSQILARLESTGIPITDSRNNITKPRIQLDAALSLSATAVVRLYNATSGQLVATQDANSSDAYSFSNVASGSYYVQAFIDTGNDAQGASEKAGAFGGSAVPTIVNATGTITANITTGIPTEIEPNNNTATNNLLLLGTFINGATVTTNQDHFKLLIPAPGSRILETFNCTGRLDTILELYNASGVLLTSDDNTGAGNCSRITYTFPSAGSYIVKVKGLSNGSGSYTVGIR